MSAGDEVTDREAILTLIGGIGTAALIALPCLFGGGCIEIAHVDSFVTLPRTRCPLAFKTKGKIKMKKIMFAALIAAVAVTVVADVYRSAPYEPRVYDDLKIRIEKNGSDYLIMEDAELFRAKYATVHFPEYHLSYAQQKELARQIAITVARFHSATNGQIRFGHYEYPEAKGTNIIDKLIQGLGGKFVTDEIVPAFDR